MNSVPTFCVPHFNEMDEHDCPVNLSISIREILVLWQALEFWSKQKPRHFDVQSNSHEARTITLLLREAMKHYEKRFDHLLQDEGLPELPKTPKDIEKCYHALISLVVPDSTTFSDVMRSARDLIYERDFWKNRRKNGFSETEEKTNV